MEKKESLRKKLEEMINEYQGDCYWASEGWGDNVPTDDDLEKEMELLLDFISQELDKAREEVFTKKELEVIEGWCYESLNLNESYPNIICEEAGTIKEKVSKLKQ